MLKFILKPYRCIAANTLLNYAIVMILLFGNGIGKFSGSHDPSHLLQNDVHCTVCISSLNLDNGGTTSVPSVTIVINSQIAYIASEVGYRLIQIVATGNCDPPYIR